LPLKPGAQNADLDSMSGSGYDPKIIERFADQLLRKADNVRVGCAVAGGIFGVFVGAVPLTPLKSVWGVPATFGVATIIVGALLGILIGYVVGEGRAFRYRVQAQSAIFQLEIERRVSSAVAQAVAQVVPARAESEDEHADDARREPPPPPPALTSVDRARTGEPLLRPPGAPAPPVSPKSEDPPAPPLSPAAIG
jgi:hypothetical protein